MAWEAGNDLTDPGSTPEPVSASLLMSKEALGLPLGTSKLTRSGHTSP